MSWRGNWGGPRQTRKRYGNEFNKLTSALIEEPERGQRMYEPTSRGVAAELGIGQAAFHRYNSGKGLPPDYLLAHLRMLTEGQRPSKNFWDWVEYFKIDLDLVYNRETRQQQEQYRFDLRYSGGGVVFHTPKFSIASYYKIRELLYAYATAHGDEPLVVPALKNREWHYILREALKNGYVGCEYEDREERTKARKASGGGQ